MVYLGEIFQYWFVYQVVAMGDTCMIKLVKTWACSWGMFLIASAAGALIASDGHDSTVFCCQDKGSNKRGNNEVLRHGSWPCGHRSAWRAWSATQIAGFTKQKQATYLASGVDQVDFVHV